MIAYDSPRRPSIKTIIVVCVCVCVCVRACVLHVRTVTDSCIQYGSLWQYFTSDLFYTRLGCHRYSCTGKYLYNRLHDYTIGCRTPMNKKNMQFMLSEKNLQCLAYAWRIISSMCCTCELLSHIYHSLMLHTGVEIRNVIGRERFTSLWIILSKSSPFEYILTTSVIIFPTVQYIDQLSPRGPCFKYIQSAGYCR